ncbi:MAG: hypothetical protein LC109_03165 [Bacteroidia bacterium]|nr:hypothetical protein [Bacteroidia bacterium]
MKAKKILKIKKQRVTNLILFILLVIIPTTLQFCKSPKRILEPSSGFAIKHSVDLEYKILLNEESQKYFRKEKMSLKDFFFYLNDSSFCENNSTQWYLLIKSIELNTWIKLSVFEEHPMSRNIKPFIYYYNSMNCHPTDTTNYLMRFDLWRVINYYGIENKLDSTLINRYKRLYYNNDSLKIVEFETLICMSMEDFSKGRKAVCSIEDAYDLFLPRSPSNNNIGCCDERRQRLIELNDSFKLEKISNESDWGK